MRRIGAAAASFAAILLTAAPACGQAAEPAAAGFALGVQTHFSHGWGPQWREAVKSVGARHLRDGLAWSKVEPRPGEYRFNAQTAGHLEWFRKQGIDVILTIQPWNGAYEGGRPVQTDEGRRAFAAYLLAVLSRYGDVVYGIEVGNELNNATGLRTVPGPQKAAVYTALLKEIYPAVKAKHPHVLIIGASTNAIGTGFITQVFKAGGGAYMDAIAVHPYRRSPEGVDGEIAHLEQVLKAYGGPKPVISTEFGSDFARASDAPGHMLKMVCLLSDAGTHRAYWYTLKDEAQFRNQGLFETNRRKKPAAATFELLQRELAAGPPVRVEAGDPRTNLFRLGADTFVVWGAQRPISFASGADVRDAEGRPISPPSSVSMTPILVKGRRSFSLGVSKVVADSLLDYGRGDWGYFAETPDGKLHALKMTDWSWTSYYGLGLYKPLRINADSLAPSRGGAEAVSAVLRYTATRAQRLRATASVTARSKGDGVTVKIRRNGSVLAERRVHAETGELQAETSVEPGDRIDFVVAPGANSSGDSVRHRFQLVAAP